ncbi:hypothetical protein [Candidatus Poriferisodalis sp.]|uniref:hypothetical protein n=1 Tax=Candidatus Poriferisodalis sp. TaxID=3101277 RepID=UPI003B022EFD
MTASIYEIEETYVVRTPIGAGFLSTTADRLSIAAPASSVDLAAGEAFEHFQRCGLPLRMRV